MQQVDLKSASNFFYKILFFCKILLIHDPVENDDFSSQDLINYDPVNIIEIKEVPCNMGEKKKIM